MNQYLAMPHFPSHTPPPESGPNLAELERYVQGRMSEAERETFEAAWSDDPFLADAIEGLQHMSDKPQLRKRLQYLRRQGQARVLLRSRHNNERNKRSKRIRPLWWPQAALGVAAALALLLMVGVLVPWRPQRGGIPAQTSTSADLGPLPPPVSGPSAPMLAAAPVDSTETTAEVQTAAQASPQAAPVPTSLQLATRDQSAASVPESSASLSAPQPANGAGIRRMANALADKQAEAFFDAEAPHDPQADSSAIAASPEAHDAPRMEEEAMVPAAARASAHSAQSLSLTRAEHILGQQQPDSLDAMRRARTSFERQAWTEARQAAMEVLKVLPGDPEALYVQGASAYWQGRYRAAIESLQQVPPEASAWYAPAQWRLVQAYLAEEQPQAARQILERLAQQPGFYQEAARHLLAKIE